MKFDGFTFFASTTAGLLLTSAAVAQQTPSKRYLVQLTDAPVAAYNGGLPGYSATRPAPGAKLNVNAAAVTSYLAYLSTRRQTALAQVTGVKALQSYRLTLNGFSASLTDDQAKALQNTAGVASVQLDLQRKLNTQISPTYLGLNTPGGVWSQIDSASQKVKGEDIIIGLIDSGISPENLAFTDRVDASGIPTNDKSGTLAYGTAPAKWKGVCQLGPGFFDGDCNNKLIGARAFNGTGRTLDATEYNSPRDATGHGTFTSSVAGGNERVPYTDGNTRDEMSGMAPRARIAMYKACWSGACFESDIIAAVEQGILDGVDVLNSSIETSQSYGDLTELAFLNATAAGVFVAGSAGNGGPDSYTVVHLGPWVTTVAASNHPFSASDVAPVVANWSSRGPNPSEFTVMKPDLTAPGVSVTAAWSYQPQSTQEHDAIAAGSLRPASVHGVHSGTSFSSPMVAGIGALMKQAHPTWSPAAIKSALLTSAGAVVNSDGSANTNRWTYGAGHINPAAAMATDLVYDAGLDDYKKFLCYEQALLPAQLDCSLGAISDASQLNSATLTALVPGTLTTVRTLTNKSNGYANYTAKAVLPGYDVVVNPAQLNLAPGASQSFKVTMKRTTADLYQTVFGTLTWSGGGKLVTSPLTANAQDTVAAYALGDTRAKGTKVFPFAAAADTGPLTSKVYGLVPAVRTDLVVPALGTACTPYSVNPQTLGLAFALFNDDTRGVDPTVNIDLDLTVKFDDTGNSGSLSKKQGTSDEFYSGYGTDPYGASQHWQICAVNQSQSAATTTLSTWTVLTSSVGAGNLRTIVPAAGVKGGTTASFGQSWSVTSGQRYFGLVEYDNPSGPLLLQSVFIDSSGLSTAPLAPQRMNSLLSLKAGAPVPTQPAPK